MSRSRHRFGEDPRRRANLTTLAVVLVVLVAGIWLLVKAINYGDDAPQSSVK